MGAPAAAWPPFPRALLLGLPGPLAEPAEFAGLPLLELTIFLPIAAGEAGATGAAEEEDVGADVVVDDCASAEGVLGLTLLLLLRGSNQLAIPPTEEADCVDVVTAAAGAEAAAVAAGAAAAAAEEEEEDSFDWAVGAEVARGRAKESSRFEGATGTTVAVVVPPAFDGEGVATVSGPPADREAAGAGSAAPLLP